MDIRHLPLHPLPGKSSVTSSWQNLSENMGQGLSLDQIKQFRNDFEKESTALHQLDTGEHQALLVTMYEGTEKLLNKNISPFEVTSYLENLKSNARELHQQGVSIHEFRHSLNWRSQSTLADMIHKT
ncbi:MAG: hypothetical protein HQM11_00725 [SAR324 cluster bacterium]|nr:hypothetical protein [SAR324 cluster bacterium]